MNFLYNIRTIARYERMTLRRSWFLRIFVLLGLIILFNLNLFTVTQVSFSPAWSVIALAASIPYTNLLLINLGQSVVAVFLAADFLKRDKKLDTAEVVYTKPVSNHEYVFGKAWGNLFVFLMIDLVLLAMVAVFNIISKRAALDMAAYFEYLLLIVIPSMIYVLGLSFLVMSLVRNQAVTFLIVLGYIAVSIFYLKERFYYLFDFMARELPIMKSDIVGFDRWQAFLYQRLFFLLLGLSFFFFTVFLLRRLPRRRRERMTAFLLGLILLLTALLSGYRHVTVRREESSLRRQVIALNEAHAGEPMASVREHAITLRHDGREVYLSSRMLLANDNDTLLGEVILSLNPGLKVSHLLIRGRQVPWRRELHLLYVQLPDPLATGDTVTLSLDYGGSIDDRICYPDIDTFRTAHKIGTLGVASSFAYVTSRYVLLTPEALWYPVTGTTYSPAHPEWYRKDFVRFRLQVVGEDSSRVVSQGVMQTDKGGVTFVPATPLPQISLSIGDYEMHQLTVDSIGNGQDSILFRVYNIRGHDYFTGSLPELTNDTLKILIRERLNNYEAKLNLHYPFSSLSLVEVPVQFNSYQHLWMGGMENVQPAIIYMAEKAARYHSADLAGNYYNFKKWSKWSREKKSDREFMAEAFNYFMDVYFRESGQFNFKREAGGQGEINSHPNPLNIFPEYFNHRFFIYSFRWPVVNRMVESYLKAPVVGMGNAWMRRYSGLSEDEQANIALQEKSFHDLLTDRSQMQILDNVIKLKGEMLFLTVKSHMKEEALLDTFLYRWLQERWFSAIPFDTLLTGLERLSEYPLREYLENWYSGTKMPGYLFSPVTAADVMADDRMQKVFTVTIANREAGSGVVKILLPGRESRVERVIWLEGHQTKRVNYFLDNLGPDVTFVTMISHNIPMTVSLNMINTRKKLKEIPLMGAQVVPESDFHYVPEGTLLVDNEDPGFSLEEPGTEGLFYRLLVKSKQQGKKYSGFSWWRPINWTLTTSDAFYGKYVRSAWFVRSGKGNRKAVWKVYVPEAGYYTVYYYLDYRRYQWGRYGSKQEYEFTIRHGDVVEEPALRLRSSQPGWNSLGFYHFPADTAVIELSDKTEYRIVVADAVKLVKE